MNKEYEVDYEKWGHVVVKAQLVIASVVCAIEILNNILLYVTRSQGYGPDTIVQKLIRYLLVTSLINFGMFFISLIVEKRAMDEREKRFLLMFFTIVMCADVAFSHYQFTICFGIFVIPIVLSILYEDWSLCVFTLLVSLAGQIVAILARAKDSEYNKDIGPEAAISLALLVSVLVFARMINGTLENRKREVRDAVIRVQRADAEAEKMAFSFKMLETLAGTIDAKDKYTNGHSVRVAQYATQIARALNWDEERVSKLTYESLLHDIGKIGVPDAILNKPSKLTDVEFGLIKSHTVVGADILKNMVVVPNASEVARYHHERYDGRGYPSGLMGEQIPINARIVCVADSFDAMNSDRIYRKALSREVIIEELQKGRGTQFDPEILDVFLDLYVNNKLVIKKEQYYVNDESNYLKYIIEDIENVIYKIPMLEEHKNSASDFDKFYIYMRNIGLRYDRSIEVLSVEFVAKDANVPQEYEDTVSDVLQVAIKKNIRSVDVYYKYSTTRHMVILLDAGIENIDIIEQRIEFDFKTAEVCNGYELKFEVNETNNNLT